MKICRLRVSIAFRRRTSWRRRPRRSRTDLDHDMKRTLEQLVNRIRREAVRNRWHVTDPFGPSPVRDHVLLVAGRTFRVRFMLTTSDWHPIPEFMLVLVERGRQRPNRQAVERLVNLFFE